MDSLIEMQEAEESRYIIPNLENLLAVTFHFHGQLNAPRRWDESTLAKR